MLDEDIEHGTLDGNRIRAALRRRTGRGRQTVASETANIACMIASARVAELAIHHQRDPVQLPVLPRNADRQGLSSRIIVITILYQSGSCRSTFGSPRQNAHLETTCNTTGESRASPTTRLTSPIRTVINRTLFRDGMSV